MANGFRRDGTLKGAQATCPKHLVCISMLNITKRYKDDFLELNFLPGPQEYPYLEG
jgi:hypothetical protein